jgi:hypothetical protein
LDWNSIFCLSRRDSILSYRIHSLELNANYDSQLLIKSKKEELKRSAQEKKMEEKRAASPRARKEFKPPKHVPHALGHDSPIKLSLTQSQKVSR